MSFKQIIVKHKYFLLISILVISLLSFGGYTLYANNTCNSISSSRPQVIKNGMVKVQLQLKDGTPMQYVERDTFISMCKAEKFKLQLINSYVTPIHHLGIGIYCYGLDPFSKSQLSMYEDTVKIGDLTKGMDEINEFYGKMTLHMATTLAGKKIIRQRIPFGETEYFQLLLQSS